MASINSNEWITTFVYRQDLRSYYMNSLLYSVVKPGVYNQGISLCTDTATGTNNIKIKIKKGTTFVFSNDYILKGNYYERSFTNQGINSDNDNVIVIKCTAFKDLEYQIEDITASITAKRLYVVAWLVYDPNSDEAGTGLGAYFPSFSIFSTNTNSRAGSNLESYFVKETGALSTIPDGKGTLDNSDKKTFYNILGVIDYSFKGLSSREFKTFDESWFKNHIFTNKGLTEYNYGVSSTKAIPNPSIMVRFNGSAFTSSLFVDWEDISINGDIYESRVDWKDVYELTSNGTDKLNGVTKGLDLSLTDSEIASITENSIVYDFIFAKVTSFSNTDSLTLDIVNSIKNNSDCLSLVNYRYIEKKTLNTSGEIALESDFKHYRQNTTEGSSNFFELPLDEESLIHERTDCTSNSYRLWKYIKNKGLLHQVMNNIRKTKLVEGTNALIPVAIAFRYIKADKSTLEGFTSTTSVNPMNVLNLLNLTSENVNYNIISNSVDNVYSVLPVIE